MHQSEANGCRVYERRPGICRAYRCAWLGGAFDEEDRPDRLGAVLDLVPRGDSIRLVIRQVDPGAMARSPRLREIADEMRSSMPVEIRDVANVLDPDHPFTVLQPDGQDLLIAGDLVEVREGGRVVARQRKPWLDRAVSGIAARIESFKLSRWPAHEERAGTLLDRSPESTDSGDSRR
jgi:hypothetical protein